MIIHALNTLRNQRTVLESAPELRTSLYREKVIEPLRPFWEPLQQRMPAGAGGDKPDPAQMMALYAPAVSEADEEGLQALGQLKRAGSWAACLEAVERAERLLRPAESGIRLESLLFTLALGDRMKLGNVHGFSGFGGNPGQAIVVVWPSDYNVPRLPSIAAHEFHHNVRLSFEPWSAETTVGQYLVVEGLAEAFAAEMFGEDMLGPWVHSLSEDQHEEVRPRYREALRITGFNEIRRYIFGDMEGGERFGIPKIGLPPHAGYAVGYRVVREYLKRSGMSAAEATYVPWEAIVEESRYL
jgi:uncharacterized protein YjaZ